MLSPGQLLIMQPYDVLKGIGWPLARFGLWGPWEVGMLPLGFEPLHASAASISRPLFHVSGMAQVPKATLSHLVLRLLASVKASTRLREALSDCPDDLQMGMPGNKNFSLAA